MLDSVDSGSLPSLKRPARTGLSSSSFGAAAFALLLSTLDRIQLESLTTVQSLSRSGPSASPPDLACAEPSPVVRQLVCLGAVAPISGCIRLDASPSLADFLHLDMLLFPRASGRTDSASAASGCARSDLLLIVPNYVHVESPLLPHSVSRPGFPSLLLGTARLDFLVLIMDSAMLGLALSMRSLA